MGLARPGMHLGPSPLCSTAQGSGLGVRRPPLVSLPSPRAGQAIDDSSAVVWGWLGAPSAGFAPGTELGLWVKGGRAGRESWVSVTSQVLSTHMVKFGFVAELGYLGHPRVPSGTRGELRRAGGSDIPLYWNRQCGLGGPGSVTVGEVREEEPPIRVADIGGPRRAELREDPQGVWGPGRGPGGARTLLRAE